MINISKIPSDTNPRILLQSKINVFTWCYSKCWVMTKCTKRQMCFSQTNVRSNYVFLKNENYLFIYLIMALLCFLNKWCSLWLPETTIQSITALFFVGSQKKRKQKYMTPRPPGARPKQSILLSSTPLPIPWSGTVWPGLMVRKMGSLKAMMVIRNQADRGVV